MGFFSGATPSFTAPELVGTVIFELRVNDGYGDSPADRVQINVLEHTGAAIFVDGDDGSDDTGDGSRAAPYATISGAINRVRGPDQDIYVTSRAGGAAYEETDTLRLQTTISLYGGYRSDWVRDVDNNRTLVSGANLAVSVGPVNADAWFSGFDLTAADADDPGESVFGIVSESGTAVIYSGTAVIYIEDNTITAGDAGPAVMGMAGGSSFGVYLSNQERAVVRRNSITSGNGGAGGNGEQGIDGEVATSRGSSGDGWRGGSGGTGGVSAANGGKGGNGGRGLIPEDGQAGGGTGGGIGDKVGAGRVGDGRGGAGGGGGGNGGRSGYGSGGGLLDGPYMSGEATGGDGGNAGNGVSGGGGGGGAGGVGLDGDGGGGGGGGGQGGTGGKGGAGGGSSVGLVLHDISVTTVENNTIVASAGGSGGNGGAGGNGGGGKNGGVGTPNVCSFLGCNVGRSGDGGEGGGGGSGGGPSYGILVGPGLTPAIRNNQVTAGNGWADRRGVVAAALEAAADAAPSCWRPPARQVSAHRAAGAMPSSTGTPMTRLSRLSTPIPWLRVIRARVRPPTGRRESLARRISDGVGIMPLLRTLATTDLRGM